MKGLLFALALAACGEKPETSPLCVGACDVADRARTACEASGARITHCSEEPHRALSVECVSPDGGYCDTETCRDAIAKALEEQTGCVK